MKVGINSCKELHGKLNFEANRFNSQLNDYDFFNFVVTAWHLYNDWIERDQSASSTTRKKKNKAPLAMLELMNITRDISTGSKHFILNRSSDEKKVVTEISDPEIKDWHSYFYGPKYGISTASAYYSTVDIVSIVSAFFDWIFDENIPLDQFPESIQLQLNRCSVTYCR